MSLNTSALTAGTSPAASLAYFDMVPSFVVFAQSGVESEPTAEPDSTSTTPTTKRKLDRRTRIELMFILVMLVAVGLGLLAFTWLTARLTRRYMKPSEKRAPRPVDPVFTDDWASKPLTEQERAKLDSSDW